jgi:hypothetical protein
MAASITDADAVFGNGIACAEDLDTDRQRAFARRQRLDSLQRVVIGRQRFELRAQREQALSASSTNGTRLPSIMSSRNRALETLASEDLCALGRGVTRMKIA